MRGVSPSSIRRIARERFVGRGAARPERIAPDARQALGRQDSGERRRLAEGHVGVPVVIVGRKLAWVSISRISEARAAPGRWMHVQRPEARGKTGLRLRRDGCRGRTAPGARASSPDGRFPTTRDPGQVDAAIRAPRARRCGNFYDIIAVVLRPSPGPVIIREAALRMNKCENAGVWATAC